MMPRRSTNLGPTGNAQDPLNGRSTYFSELFTTELNDSPNIRPVLIPQPLPGVNIIEGTRSSKETAIIRLGTMLRYECLEPTGTPPQHKNYKNSYATTQQDGLASDTYALFKESVPTNERLIRLLDGWSSTKALQLRLAYCRPFNIVLLEQGKLVMKTPEDLTNLLEQTQLQEFFSQVSDSWPVSFGRLKSVENVPYSFQWHADPSQLDDGTVFLCRIALKDREQIMPLEALLSPGTGDVFFHPSDFNLLWQIMPKAANSVLTMRTIAFLESLFAPNQNTSNLPSYGSLNDWFPIQRTTPVFHSTGRFGDWFCIQMNLRACVPDLRGQRNKNFLRSWGISPRSVGLPLNRQTARIPDLSQGSHTTLVEYLISVAMVSRRKFSTDGTSTMKYDVIAWVDYDTDFEKRSDWENIYPVLSNRVDKDLGFKYCGTDGEAVFHFLMVLAKSVDHWKRCWDHTLDKVDDIITVQLQDTLDRKRWNSLMFDDSLQLSEQYFTILQLLRICQNWIGETERGIGNLGDELIKKCDTWKAWQREYAPNDLSRLPLHMTNLRHNITCLQDFFHTRALPLKERIELKRSEVSSLQDALLSTSSLRETLKAKTLNLYIGVFTMVTVFFTPLGFIATLWTIPFLQGNWADPIPKGFSESFIAVPVSTYAISGFIILYFWIKSSQRPVVLPDSNLKLDTRDNPDSLVSWATHQVKRTTEIIQAKMTRHLDRRDRSDPALV